MREKNRRKTARKRAAFKCARRIAGRPRVNAPPSRRSRRSAALAPPAETGPFGLRIVLRRGRDAERDAAACAC